MRAEANTLAMPSVQGIPSVQELTVEKISAGKHNANQPPLVFLHGWGLNHGIWRPLAEQLKANYRVTLIDLPGFGHSSAILPNEYNLQNFNCSLVKFFFTNIKQQYFLAENILRN